MQGRLPTATKKTYALGNKLAKDGSIIVCGLALGCDKAAHEGCLDAGGKTIAIVASGLNIIHPKENTTLPQRIMDNNSLVLSEYPLGVKVNSSRLIARNRLQAALSESVILVECPEHSGRQHAYTIRFARKYKKQCFALLLETIFRKGY